MNDSEPDGFQPAPWEAGKPKQPVGYGQQPPAGPPQGAPPGYLGQPPQQGAQPPGAGFGGGDMGRARTRQIPNQPLPGGPGPAAYQPPPAGAPQGYPQAPQGYPPAQQGPPPQGGQVYPLQAGGPPAPYGTQVYGNQKSTSVFAILALVFIGLGCFVGLFSAGIFSIPLFLAGAVLGYVGMRETAAWGKKSGRKMAVGGTVANLVLMTLNGGWLLVAFLFLQSAGTAFEDNMNADLDAMLIQERVHMYHEAKGDLKPGGPQFKAGFRNDTPVTGPALQVTDLVSPSELTNPIEQYTMEVNGDMAVIYWTPSGGVRREVARYGGFRGFDDSDFGGFDSTRRRH